MKFDDVLTEIGEFGWYQRYVLALVWLPGILAGFFFLNAAVLLETPIHRCAKPGLDNDTYAVQDGYHASLISLTIPPSDKDGEVYEPCHLYSPANTYETNTLHRPDNVTMLTCDTWVYDTSVFTDTFVSKFDLVCDKAIWGTNAAMLFYGGMLVGAIGCGILSDRYGRKRVVCVFLFLTMATGLALAWANSYWMLLVLEFVLGAVGNSAYLTSFVLSVEITGRTKRMWASVSIALSFTTGLLLYAGITSALRAATPILFVTSLPGALCIPYWWLMPESPRWLLSKGRVEEAGQILQKAARWNNTVLPAEIYDKKLQDDIKQQDSGGTLLDLFSTRTMIKQTLLICFNWLAVVLCYFVLALNTGNLGGSFYLNFFLSALVELPSYVIVIATLDRVGRRSLYIIFMIVGGASCLSTLLAREYATDISILIVVLAMVGRLGACAGLTLLYTYTAELYPTVIRNVGMGVGSMSGRVGAMVAPYIVSLGGLVGGSVGQSLSLIIIGVVALLSALVTAVLPETLNVRLSDTIRDTETLVRKSDRVNDAEKSPLLDA